MRSALIAPLLAALSLLVACGDDGSSTTTTSGSGGSSQGGGSGDGDGDGDGGDAAGPTTTTSVATTSVASTGVGSTGSTGGTGGDGTGGSGTGGDGTGGSGTGGAEPVACPGGFECSDGDCIPYAFFCDGSEDCADGQDEDIDACGGFVDGTGICDSLIAFTDNPGLNLCASATCCGEFNACTDNGADVDSCIACFEAGSGALCDDALACVAAECAGGGSQICDSALTTGDLDRDYCLATNCCEEHEACIGTGSEADVQACVDCFVEGAGALCDDAIACGDAQCPVVEPAGICDSGLTTNDAEDDVCLGDACCDEFNACTALGADIDACVACLTDGGGALCDDALDCAATNCP